MVDAESVGYSTWLSRRPKSVRVCVRGDEGDQCEGSHKLARTCCSNSSGYRPSGALSSTSGGSNCQITSHSSVHHRDRPTDRLPVPHSQW